MRPFIGRVEASTSEAPAGDRATDPGNDEPFAVGTVGTERTGDRHHVIADRQIARDPGPDLVEDACGVHAEHVRRRDVAHEQPGRLPDVRIGGIHRGGVDPDPHLTGAGVRLGQVEHTSASGPPAELHDTHCLHDTCFTTPAHTTPRPALDRGERSAVRTRHGAG